MTSSRHDSLSAGQQPRLVGSRSWARRLIMPLLVLLAAGGIFIYAQVQEAQRQQQAVEVQDAVRELCEQIAQMPAGGARPPAALEMQASLTVVEQLHALLATRDATLRGVSIDVAVGDVEPPYGDGSATHHVMIRIEGRAEMGLRAVHPGDEQSIRIIGFWTP